VFRRWRGLGIVWRHAHGYKCISSTYTIHRGRLTAYGRGVGDRGSGIGDRVMGGGVQYSM